MPVHVVRDCGPLPSPQAAPEPLAASLFAGKARVQL